MMRYLQLRIKIYYHELKEMLPAVGQLLAFLLSILYLAITASILTALISLSVIEDIHTPIEQRIIYQWGYFLLLYFLIRIQKKAILALNYQYYLSCLPTSIKLKHSITLLLTLIAGNLPLLAPVFLLAYIPDWPTFIRQLHFPVFALSILLLAWLSLKNKSLPWLSLLVAPLVVLLAIKASSLSALSLNSLWLLLLLVEAYYQPVSFITNKSLPVKYYWQVRWIGIMKNPANILMRILFCGLFIGMIAYVQYKMDQIANAYIQVLIFWVLAIVIGSYQFDNERFYQQYPHYLSGLLNKFSSRYCLDMLPALLMTLGSALLVYFYLNFSMAMITLLPIGVLITLLSVSKYHRNFFISPSLVYALIMFIL